MSFPVKNMRGLARRHRLCKETGEKEIAGEITACVIIGSKLCWSNEQIVSLANRLVNRKTEYDHLRHRWDVLWEVDAEIERLNGSNRNDFNWLVKINNKYNAADKCAPLILIRAQAAVNVAFQKVFAMSRENDKPFDTPTFEQIAVYQFRVPGQLALDSMTYLLQHSAIGIYRERYDDPLHPTCAAGIEGSLRETQKKRLIGAVIGIAGGKRFVEELLVNLSYMISDDDIEGSDSEEGRSIELTEAPLKRAIMTFVDQQWLVLDDFVRRERGWGVIGNELRVRSCVVRLQHL